MTICYQHSFLDILQDLHTRDRTDMVLSGRITFIKCTESNQLPNDIRKNTQWDIHTHTRTQIYMRTKWQHLFLCKTGLIKQVSTNTTNEAPDQKKDDNWWWWWWWCLRLLQPSQILIPMVLTRPRSRMHWWGWVGVMDGSDYLVSNGDEVDCKGEGWWWFYFNKGQAAVKVWVSNRLVTTDWNQSRVSTALQRTWTNHVFYIFQQRPGTDCMSVMQLVNHRKKTP